MTVLSRSLFLSTSIGLALVGQPAVSQTPGKRLAVLEFKGAKIEGEVLDAFADAVRGGTVEGLAGRRVQVMTRENMMVLLKEMGKKECSEGDCEVETARNIGADFVVSGSVVRIDAAFVVTLKLHETRGGSLLASDQIDAKSQLEVLRQLRDRGRNLVASNIGPRSAAPVQPRPKEPEASATTRPPRPAPQPALGCAAGQVAISGGTFWMGDPDYAKPVHKVTLSPFCIDRTEVTVAAYRACVQDGGCPPPSATVDWKDIKPEEKAKWRQYCTWGRSGLDQHPINCVDWNQATTYCEWTGGRLPTEAEWEYAARGKDGRIYPWGNERPDATRLNACGGECSPSHMYAGNDGWPATAPVGSYPEGASPFGVLDMVGNVWEWTADGFAAYSEEPVTDPQRVQSDGSLRVFRGGSWTNVDPAWVRAGYRNKRDPGSRTMILGFRCARTPKN
jgi:formylglycine-generating enzyme required for sulfatase activity